MFDRLSQVCGSSFGGKPSAKDEEWTVVNHSEPAFQSERSAGQIDLHPDYSDSNKSIVDDRAASGKWSIDMDFDMTGFDAESMLYEVSQNESDKAVQNKSQIDAQALKARIGLLGDHPLAMANVKQQVLNKYDKIMPWSYVEDCDPVLDPKEYGQYNSFVVLRNQLASLKTGCVGDRLARVAQAGIKVKGYEILDDAAWHSVLDTVLASTRAKADKLAAEDQQTVTSSLEISPPPSMGPKSFYGLSEYEFSGLIDVRKDGQSVRITERVHCYKDQVLTGATLTFESGNPGDDVVTVESQWTNKGTQYMLRHLSKQQRHATVKKQLDQAAAALKAQEANEREQRKLLDAEKKEQRKVLFLEAFAKTEDVKNVYGELTEEQQRCLDLFRRVLPLGNFDAQIAWRVAFALKDQAEDMDDTEIKGLVKAAAGMQHRQHSSGDGNE